MVNSEKKWDTRGICFGSDVNFFSEADLSETPTQAEQDSALLETMRARSICVECPVRRECLETALDDKHRFGVWGGADQATIRKVLSINEDGEPVARAKDMKCPYCYSSSVSIRTRRRNMTQMGCADCDLIWWAAKLPPGAPTQVRDIETSGNNVE